MEVRWTSEQQKVIDYRNRNILVSAAAGSGKTAVLVERIINRIAVDKNPIDIDNMLVVTFTKAAAAEMRERVSLAIDKKRLEDPENENLMRQSTLVHNALITTIDSFCLFVVQNHFSEINLDPDFRIGENGELTLLLKDVMDEVFEKNYKKGNEAFLTLIDTYSKGRSDNAVRQMVEQIYKVSASSSWPVKWIEALSDLYDIDDPQKLNGSDIINDITQYCTAILKEIKDQLAEAYELADSVAGLEKYAATIADDLSMFDGLDEVSDFASLCAFADGIKMGNIAVIRKFDGEAALKERVKSLRNAAKDSIAKLKKNYFSMDIEQIFKQIKRQKPYVDELIRLSLEFLETMEYKKRQKKVFDFSDIEHFALQILIDKQTLLPTATALEFKKQFEEIMIDEYQDSNQVQEDILCAISRNDTDTPNMFMVGDVKQSIYRFRLAKPELFMSKFNSYSIDESKNQRIDLHKNFRSRNQVIDFANDIFYKIMSKDLGNVEYDDDAALYAGAAFENTQNTDEVMKPEIMLIDMKDEDLSRIIEDEDGDKVKIEALMIANRIKGFMENGFVTDKKDNKPRNARYSDIVILSRSIATWGNTVADVLKDCGIPAHVESSTGYFSSYEIQVILSFLQILDNPLQDIPMAAVLKSPIAGLDDEQLAQISVNHRDVSFSQAALIEMEEEDGMLAGFAALYNKLRAAVPDTSIHRLLHMILDETGFDRYAAAMPAGRRRIQNINMLIEMAVSYEKTSFKGLFHFIRYIAIQQKYEIDYGEADVSGENDDVVRIMTIHKSKGLEFPVVFVSGLGRKFNLRETTEDLVLHSDMGLGLIERTQNPRTKRRSLIRSEIEGRIKRESLGEELRVLYVALTRAKEKIILTGSLKDVSKSYEKYRGNILKGKPISFAQREGAACYLDWIIPALLSYPDKYTISTIDADEFASRIAQDLADSDVSRMQLIEKIRQADENEAGKIADGFAYDYPYAKDITQKSKYSVSELKRDSMTEKYGQTQNEAEKMDFLAEDTEPYVPDFAKKNEAVFIESDVNKGALRGTAVHRVMECLDFKGALDINLDYEKQVYGYVVKDISRMLDEKLITEDMKKLVNPSGIKEFLMSDTGQRMAKADAQGNLFREKPFVMECDGVLVQGIIDVFWIEDDKIILLDYKTDRVDSADELVTKYKTQLLYYADALSRIFSTEEKTYRADEMLIYSFRLREVIKI